MDFILKKIVSMFFMPLPIGVILILLALILIHINKIKRAKFMLTLSIAWFFLFSYNPFVDLLLEPLETKYTTLHQAPQGIKYIYVLGSGHHTDKSQPITSQVDETAVVRLNEGIRLYRQLQGNAKLIVSGYSGLYDPTPHALMQEKLATVLGVPKNHLILHPEPRDTQEEALAAKKLLSDAPFILVTSASHMARSMKFFAHEGLTPLPAPTNHLASLQHPNYTDFFSSSALYKSRVLFHEVLGLVWQKIKGI
ncbi:MAG: YdcF family protein [Sulfurovum sp.]|nr:YdcF family protein [Sulfurovum sp.]